MEGFASHPAAGLVRVLAFPPLSWNLEEGKGRLVQSLEGKGRWRRASLDISDRGTRRNPAALETMCCMSRDRKQDTKLLLFKQGSNITQKET